MTMNNETGSSFPSSPQPSRRKWLYALLLFFCCGLILLFVSLQYYWPDKWWGSARVLGWGGESMMLVKGQGYGAQHRLTIDGLAEQGVALVTVNPPVFRAEDYPVVHWSVSGAAMGGGIEFLWRTAESPGRVYARPLEWRDNGIQPLHLEGDSNWRGQITGLALMVHTPLTVEAVKLVPFVPLGIVWREWFGMEPWLGTSINFVGGNEPRQWLAPLPFAVAVLVLAVLCYGLLMWRKVIAYDVRMVWMLVFLAWFVLDARWQLDLWHKLDLTRQTYAGKSWEEKHLAAVDGSLFDLMQRIRARLPSGAARVFLFADDEYMRGRSAYHLYPFNVLSNRDLLSAKQFKSGDFIIILGKDEVEYDPSQGVLKWGAQQQLGADLLLLADNNVLLKVR